MEPTRSQESPCQFGINRVTRRSGLEPTGSQRVPQKNSHKFSHEWTRPVRGGMGWGGGLPCDLHSSCFLQPGKFFLRLGIVQKYSDTLVTACATSTLV